VQSAFVVQSCGLSAAHFVSHFEVIVRPTISSQHTSPAVQLFEPEQTSVSPRQAAFVAMHVRVVRQQTSVVELQLVVPHAV
jgi:hypothetical protein